MSKIPDSKDFPKLIPLIGILVSVRRMLFNVKTDFSVFIQQHYVNNNSGYITSNTKWHNSYYCLFLEHG